MSLKRFTSIIGNKYTLNPTHSPLTQIISPSHLEPETNYLQQCCIVFYSAIAVIISLGCLPTQLVVGESHAISSIFGTLTTSAPSGRGSYLLMVSFTFYKRCVGGNWMIQFPSYSGFSVHNLCSLAFIWADISWDGGSNVINMLITFYGCLLCSVRTKNY